MTRSCEILKRCAIDFSWWEENLEYALCDAVVWREERCTAVTWGEERCAVITRREDMQEAVWQVCVWRGGKFAFEEEEVPTKKVRHLVVYMVGEILSCDWNICKHWQVATSYGGGTLKSAYFFKSLSTFSTTTHQYQMIKITNPESIDIHLFSKPRIQLCIISVWGGRGTLSNIMYFVSTVGRVRPKLFLLWVTFQKAMLPFDRKVFLTAFKFQF